MDFSFPEEAFQENIQSLTQNLLGDDYLKLHIRKLILEEDFEENCCRMECYVAAGSRMATLQGRGTGVVEVLYGAVVDWLKEEYLCLPYARFADFGVTVKFKESTHRSCRDAPVEIIIVLRTLSHRHLYFKARSSSLVRAAISATRNAIEFLVNCERSVLILDKLVTQAQASRRQDLVANYTAQLAELVRVTPFEKTLRNAHERRQ